MPLRERTGGDDQLKNVADVDLRVAVPSVLFVFLVALVLGLTAGAMWMVFVWRKKRRHFNSFSSVSDLLELLVERNVVEHTCEEEEDDMSVRDAHVDEETMTMAGVDECLDNTNSMPGTGLQEEKHDECERSSSSSSSSEQTFSTALDHELSSPSPLYRQDINTEHKRIDWFDDHDSDPGSNAVTTIDERRLRMGIPCVCVAGDDASALRVRRALDCVSSQHGENDF